MKIYAHEQYESSTDDIIRAINGQDIWVEVRNYRSVFDHFFMRVLDIYGTYGKSLVIANMIPADKFGNPILYAFDFSEYITDKRHYGIEDIEVVRPARFFTTEDLKELLDEREG